LIPKALIFKCNKGQLKRHRAFTQKASCIYSKGIVHLLKRHRAFENKAAMGFFIGVQGFTIPKGETFSKRVTDETFSHIVTEKLSHFFT
jgi:hypothetical protein